MKTFLATIAQARSGDKGNTADVSLFADSPKIYELLKKEVTVEKVKAYFHGICKGEVERFEVPNVYALKFILHESLGGGAPRSIRIDNLGKALGAAILRMEIDVPEELMSNLKSKQPPKELSAVSSEWSF
ncbi:hypothetical protein MKY41_08290 [Sporosarcina sp. FSL W7-1349]|uniref:AtuA-related protein n=1 Tax=Sporosarcina sp. FSL W7-1349 TaxID=2921561 RepID=UPI0030FB1387